MFLFPITGEVRQITVRGRWQALDPDASLERSVALLGEREEALRVCEGELRDATRALQEKGRRLDEVAGESGRKGRESQEKDRRLEELANELAGRGREAQEKGRRLEEVAGALAERDRQLQAILSSRRWRLINAIRSLVPFRFRRRAG